MKALLSFCLQANVKIESVSVFFDDGGMPLQLVAGVLCIAEYLILAFQIDVPGNHNPNSSLCVPSGSLPLFRGASDGNCSAVCSSCITDAK